MPVNIKFYFTDSDSDSEGEDVYEKAAFATILRFASTKRNARPALILSAKAAASQAGCRINTGLKRWRGKQCEECGAHTASFGVLSDAVNTNIKRKRKGKNVSRARWCASCAVRRHPGACALAPWTSAIGCARTAAQAKRRVGCPGPRMHDGAFYPSGLQGASGVVAPHALQKQSPPRPPKP